jgi:hypothetical protein
MMMGKLRAYVEAFDVRPIFCVVAPLIQSNSLDKNFTFISCICKPFSSYFLDKNFTFISCKPLTPS